MNNQYVSLLKNQPLSAAIRANARGNIGLTEKLVFVSSLEDFEAHALRTGNLLITQTLPLRHLM